MSFCVTICLFTDKHLPGDTGHRFHQILCGVSVFTYKCGDMSFSNPGIIGFTNTEIGLSVTHGATYREYPHYLSCLNEATTPWFNVIYKIADSGRNIAVLISITYNLSFFYAQHTETPFFALLRSLEGASHETHYVPAIDDGVSDPILVANGFPLQPSIHNLCR